MTDLKRRPGRFSTSFPVLAQRLLPESWPIEDRNAWDRARRSGRGMDPGGNAAKLRPATQDLHADAWGCYLRWLAHVGELLPSELPQERLTPRRLGDFLVQRRESRSARTVRAQTIQLSYMAAALAPGRDWSWVRRHPAIPTESEAVDGGKRKKFCDSRVMVTNALRFCEDAENIPDALASAIRFRDGLLVAMSFSSALRRKNVCQLQIGKTILIEDRYIRLVFESDDTKNARVIDTLVAEFLIPFVIRYVSYHRPILLQGSADDHYLWINRLGKPLSYHAIYGLFRSRTEFLIGLSLNPHSTRYSLASGIIQDDPKNLDLAADCLSHRGMTTVQRFYNQAGPGSASAVWLKTLEKKIRRPA